MIQTLALLLVFQLAGEALARGLSLPVPGPVIGMVGLLALLALRPRVAEAVQPTVRGLLAHLSLLFVPAGVGVVGHLDRMGDEGLALFAALLLSTIGAIAVGAAVFVAVARLTGAEAGPGERRELP